MYKKVLKNIKEDIQKKEDFISELFKKEGNHGIHDKKPHYIFSAENPFHPVKLRMSHKEALDFLKRKGYDAEEMDGKYGSEEKSIIIHNPPKNSFRHLNNFAAALGQDSAIISDGYNHEMHYLNGKKAGKFYKGQGTVFHEKPPSDFYSTLEDGTHFTHGFDTDKLHSDSKFIKQIAGSIKKSEDLIKNNVFSLKKAEDVNTHPLAHARAGTKLIHYSPQQGLYELNPEHHGVRGIGSEAKQGAPEHKMTFYYTEGVEPESLVTSGAKSKYVVDIGNKKLYDIAKDPNKLWQKAMDSLQNEANQREFNKGIIMPYEKTPAFHKEIKNAGFHGIYNSGLDNTMSNVVGMFETMYPEAEHEIHPEDFKKTSAKGYHAEDKKKEAAKQWADKNGHHNSDFLYNLKNKFEE